MSDPDHLAPDDRPDRARRSRESPRDPAPVDRSVQEPVGAGSEQPDDGEEPPDGPTWMPV